MRLQCQYLLGTYGDHKVLYHSPLSARVSEIKSKTKRAGRGMDEKGCSIKLPTMGKANSQAHIKSDKIFITLWPHIIGLRPSSSPAPGAGTGRAAAAAAAATLAGHNVLLMTLSVPHSCACCCCCCC